LDKYALKAHAGGWWDWCPLISFYSEWIPSFKKERKDKIVFFGNSVSNLIRTD
jgi:hypothetical protein